MITVELKRLQRLAALPSFSFHLTTQETTTFCLSCSFQKNTIFGCHLDHDSDLRMLPGLTADPGTFVCLAKSSVPAFDCLNCFRPSLY